MRLSEIKKEMQVGIVNPYNAKLQSATVIGIRHIRVNNRWLRYISLFFKIKGRKYYTTAWARNLRLIR